MYKRSIKTIFAYISETYISSSNVYRKKLFKMMILTTYFEIIEIFPLANNYHKLSHIFRIIITSQSPKSMKIVTLHKKKINRK